MNNNYETYVLYGLVVLVVGVLVYSLSSFVGTPVGKEAPPSQAARQEKAGFGPITTGTTDPGSVEVTLTPRKAKDGTIAVEIAANTHSVDLSQFDLGELTTLRYGGGEAKPVSVPALSGHHASGLISFDVSQDAFTIIMKGIPNVDERVFDWT